MSETFTTFIRSARNFQEFGSAEKIVQETGLEFREARAQCYDFNQNRTQDEIDKGTMMEFTADGNI